MSKQMLRKATLADADAIAKVYLTSRKELVSFAPLIHSDENIYQWIRNELLLNEQVIVAEDDGVIFGMMSLTQDKGMGRITQLYILPSAVGLGVGTLMINMAKSILGSPIQLDTFQENIGARRFYERHGFRAIEFNDGSDNEENRPAILYEWQDKPTTYIRIANERDAPAIANIHVASWQKIYRGHIPDAALNNLSINEREEQWLELIKNNVKILVIELNNQIVGFASIGPSRDTDSDPTKCGEISAIYFHPDFWRQGLGSKLCNKAFILLEEMGFNEVTVWALKENILAKAFYQSLGFNDTPDTKTDEYVTDVILNEIRYRKNPINPFTFKPLQKTDLDLLCQWFDKPHVKEWWNDKISHEEIKKKYGNRIGESEVVPFIAYFNDKPIGFIQYYHANKVDGGWWPDESEGTVGIDQFIGDENFINRGYGTQLLRAFRKKLFENHHIKKIITDVDPTNKRAITCYKNSGFELVKLVSTPDGVAYLMEQYRV